jgi:hypothetical protein
MAIRQASVPWQRGYDFGVGVDLVSGSPMAKVVDDQHVAPGEAGGATVDFSIDRVRTTSDLEQALGIDVDMSYGSAAFGAGVEARFEFAKKCEIQATSLFMSVTALVQLEFLSIDDPALTDDAAGLVVHPDQFADRFGNMFVRGLSRGGLFVGLLRVDTRSQQDSESIAGELHGSYGLFSADAQAKFQDLQSKFQASSFVQMHHEGGPVDLAITDPTDPMQLLNNANLFLKSFRDNPSTVAVPYEVTLAPITIAQGPAPLTSTQIQHAEDVLTFCAKQRSTQLDQLNQLQYIVDNPSHFDFSSGASLAAVQRAASDTQGDLDLIASCASAAINDPGNAKMPADFASTAQTTYPKATMPDPLPTATAATPQVAVPNVLGAGSSLLSIGHSLIAQAGLTAQDDGPLQITGADGQLMDGQIVGQNPAAGTMVAQGSVVTLHIGNYHLHTGFIPTLGLGHPHPPA